MEVFFIAFTRSILELTIFKFILDFINSHGQFWRVSCSSHVFRWRIFGIMLTINFTTRPQMHLGIFSFGTLNPVLLESVLLGKSFIAYVTYSRHVFRRFGTLNPVLLESVLLGKSFIAYVTFRGMFSDVFQVWLTFKFFNLASVQPSFVAILFSRSFQYLTSIGRPRNTFGFIPYEKYLFLLSLFTVF